MVFLAFVTNLCYNAYYYGFKVWLAVMLYWSYCDSVVEDPKLGRAVFSTLILFVLAVSRFTNIPFYLLFMLYSICVSKIFVYLYEGFTKLYKTAFGIHTLIPVAWAYGLLFSTDNYTRAFCLHCFAYLWRDHLKFLSLMIYNTARTVSFKFFHSQQSPSEKILRPPSAIKREQ